MSWQHTSNPLNPSSKECWNITAKKQVAPFQKKKQHRKTLQNQKQKNHKNNPASAALLHISAVWVKVEAVRGWVVLPSTFIKAKWAQKCSPERAKHHDVILGHCCPRIIHINEGIDQEFKKLSSRSWMISTSHTLFLLFDTFFFIYWLSWSLFFHGFFHGFLSTLLEIQSVMLYILSKALPRLWIQAKSPREEGFAIPPSEQPGTKSPTERFFLIKIQVSAWLGVWLPLILG